ncbi:transcription factor RFX4 isoform X1 [Hydra vulgaris]|uniref:transcription factor RFX4 isoform X1 n=1 Tax=Hydra vulgaris TaxID=6087 RepID=UPI0002B49CFD|nr:transcription factor RFX4-like isoform X1 [Hydra vulgaris]XP_047129834.1 transcription factor RFX4-like isoform X1 [Hydra vulgaris]
MENPCKNFTFSKLQSPVTTQWLHENYEMLEGVSLPRIALYTHYLDFCNSTNVTPVNAASFGKIIRSTFPELKTRRLGTRGKSKYHYFGICVKKTSVYYDQTISFNHLKVQSTLTETSKKNDSKSDIIEPSRDHENLLLSNGALLPPFPSFDSVIVEDDSTLDKVKTLLIMYRAHCQRILDTIFRANFGEVQNFLIHFWHGMPSHIAVVLSNKNVIELIKCCDVILYKAVSSVLIPTSLQPLPSSLSQAIQHFAKQLPIYLEMALYHLPHDLQIKKISVANIFTQSLLRQTSLSHLAQASKTVLHNNEHLSQMIADIRTIKSDDICKYVVFISREKVERDVRIVEKLFSEFDNLFERQATIEEYTFWISSVVSRYVTKPSESVAKFQSLAQEFLLKWTYVTSKIIQELTLRSAKSFGSFHLVLMFFNDYIFYLIESHTDINEVRNMKKYSQSQHSMQNNNNISPYSRLRHSLVLQRSPLLLGNTSSYSIPCSESYQQFIFEEPNRYNDINFEENSYLDFDYCNDSINMPDSNQSDQHYADSNQSDQHYAALKIAQDLQEKTKSLFGISSKLIPRIEFYS